MRGYLIKNPFEGFKTKSIGSGGAVIIALAVTSIAFGLAHLSNQNSTIVGTINLMFIGILFGAGYIYTGELAIPVGYHISWNFFQANVFGSPVSGVTYPAGVVSVFKKNRSDKKF